VKTIAFFNNKGGVGKTSLVYHLAWMFADLGLKVIAADLDPQANLTAMFLDEERVEELWTNGDHAQTVFGAIQPLDAGLGDVREPHLEQITENLWLVPGDLVLSRFEDELSSQWPDCLDGRERAFRVISSFYRLLQMASVGQHADVVLVDVGPNLGAINRAAIIAAKYVVVPLAPDLFSLQGMKNLGPTLRKWREGWKERLNKNPEPTLELPGLGMEPIGYIIQQHSIRLDRPVQAYSRWMDKIPSLYRTAILNQGISVKVPKVDTDQFCLATLKHYRSLMPMAMEARKPMFHLKPADGAIGAHAKAVQDCRMDFQDLAESIAALCKLALPA